MLLIRYSLVAFICFIQFLWHILHWHKHRIFHKNVQLAFRLSSSRKLVLYLKKLWFPFLVAVLFNGGPNFISLFFHILNGCPHGNKQQPFRQHFHFDLIEFNLLSMQAKKWNVNNDYAKLHFMTGARFCGSFMVQWTFNLLYINSLTTHCSFDC